MSDMATTNIAEQHQWLNKAPSRPGRYRWRTEAGADEHTVHIGHELTSLGETGVFKLCYSITDFTEMTAGGQWQFQADAPTCEIPRFYVEGRVAEVGVWHEQVPESTGRYFWREHADAAPMLVHVCKYPVDGPAGFKWWYGIYGAVPGNDTTVLLRQGQWAPVGTDMWY